MRFLTTLGFLLTAMMCLQAQSASVNGWVIDQASGQALPGVEVLILELDQSNRSDSEGRFSFSQLPSGAYEL